MLSLYSQKDIIVGCDEAGRGCLAGPVFAAAVILPKSFSHPLLNDSKKLSEKERDILRPIIEEESVSWSVQSLSPRQIEKYNILWSSFRAMHKAIDKLKTPFDQIIVDGNRFIPYSDVPHECIIKGDAIYMSIAAASVLAKTHRDEYMKKLSKKFPFYSWESNKGYPSREHRKAIAKHGACIHHRRTFRLLPNQSTFDFSS